jgi:hypothetical protein
MHEFNTTIHSIEKINTAVVFIGLNEKILIEVGFG